MSMIGNFVAIDGATLSRLLGNPDEVVGFLYPEDGDGPSDALDVDKAWHAIHFTLNGSQWEGRGVLGMAVLGGTEIGEDAGYGPARYLVQSQVKEVADALSDVSKEGFIERFNPQAMDEHEIYPQIWLRDGDFGRSYALGHFVNLVKFYREAADRDDAMLLFIN
jgi:hypothetical protein